MSVRAKFNYLAPISRLLPPEPPFRYAFAPPKGRPLHNEVLETHDHQLFDIRGHLEHIGLGTTGFGVLLDVPTKMGMSDWETPERITNQYYPETVSLLKSKLGACEVHIFDHTIRKREPHNDNSEDRAGMRRPVFRVHADQTPTSGEYRVKSILGESRGADALKKHVQIVNIWRPLRGPVQDSPVGCIDRLTLDWQKDMVVGEIHYRDRTGYTYLVHHNVNHRWYYLSNMMSDETLLIKCYDNRDPEAIAAHSGFAFDNPPANFLPRQSIEIRALLVFDEPAYPAQ